MELTLKQKIAKYIKKVLRSYRGIPDKKVYLEFLTGLLSIPVLLTVILLNVSNLNNSKKDAEPSPTPAQQIIYVSPGKNNDEAKPTPTISEACKKGIGEVTIASPDDGEVIRDNPVDVIIRYTPGEYCAVVWSHRINNGSWSNFDDKSIALYNLPKGNIKFDLRVKSIVSGEEKNLSRSFVYDGPTSSVTDPTPVASSAAN